MRVKCSTIDEFVTNLKAVDPSEIFQRRVYVSRTRRPVDGNQRDASKFLVTLQASAVVSLRDGGEYLLDYGEDCSFDYEDASQERKGTAAADAGVSVIKATCDALGLAVMPGVVDY